MINRKWIWLACLASFMMWCACEEDDQSITPPGLSTISVNGVNSSSVVLSAKVLTLGNGKIINKGFCWSKEHEEPGLEHQSIRIGGDGTTIKETIVGLESETVYYIRAYAENEAGLAYSPAVSITTGKLKLLLGSVQIRNVGIHSATFSSEIVETAGEAITERGFCFSSLTLNPQLGSESVIQISAGTSSPFEAEAEGLNSHTLYHIRSYAIIAGEVIYSEVNSFRTDRSELDKWLEDFVIPDYADDYSPIASWNDRDKWNLANVHDPTVEKCGEYYYMYGTDASYGNAHEGKGHFPYRRSRDLVNWEFLGMSMGDTPAWVKDTLNNMRGRLNLAPITEPAYGYWAPVVRKAGNKYRMYYSIIIDNYIQTGKQSTQENFDGSWTERAFIGLRETDDLASGQWEDKGMVVSSASDRGLNWSRNSLNNWSAYFKWNAIDPSYLITPEGKHWLVYGSWHSGIVALELDGTTGKPLKRLGEPWVNSSLPDYGTLIATRSSNNRWQGSEAPEIIYNEETGYYYLFLAYDELSVAYNTRVARSKNITGPYLDYLGRNITSGSDCKPVLTHPYKFAGHSGWVGISHCCVFDDGQGNWFYSSQGRLPANTNGNAYSNAIMMGHVRKIRWTSDGWPVVMPERYVGIPDIAIEESELIGNWEHIDLSYQLGVQQASKVFTLQADGIVSGALTGQWSFDPQEKILRINNTKLYLEREADWEASPRCLTLVYAGLSSSGDSWWGKKMP